MLQDVPAEESSPREASFVEKLAKTVQVRHQKFLDDVTPHRLPRWVVCAVLIVIFALRIYRLQGWYIVAYGLAIYVLNLFIAFLSPKIDPALAELEANEDGPTLPMKGDEEFRPFIRRLPEFKFWYGITRGVVIALFMTLFQAFNLPVFWPILVFYFFFLFFIIMKRQIRHMIRYRYVPFTYGKQTYAGKDDAGKK